MFIRPTWAEVELSAIAHNIRQFQRHLAKNAIIMAVVKANGYGHGAFPVARTALEAGARYLAVATADEAIELREEGITAPILILGFTPPDRAADIVRYELTQTVFQTEMLDALESAAKQQNKRVRIHIKVDTGMGRIGLRDLCEIIPFVKNAHERPSIFVEGIFTHLATADEADKRYMWEQVNRWNDIVHAIEEQGIKIPLKHVANSAATIDHPELHLDMVRIGISMYGYYPSSEVHKEHVHLRPALTFKSRVIHVKTLPGEQSISYGATYRTKNEERIATIPVGYADGYSRLLSNRGFVLVGGKRCPIVGRVCMDQLMVNVTHVPDVKVGDEVVLYGSQGQEQIHLDEVASIIGTISYEIACAVGRRVPRVYLWNGQITEVKKY
ncbi:alanine racemase [Collibacillus ludicampi]|uniref:Alanine racemase n=1 Tax=Collibacillus ludicampi TaxID=2771369 RepID=A0AAV4LFK8_9BACL|nr:alanine racemase [Collibacillus ludicampi]GIM46242.1 alanine racemase [Collibacillus ludicampi]